MNVEVSDGRGWCPVCSQWTKPALLYGSKCGVCDNWHNSNKKPPTAVDTPSATLTYEERARGEFIRREIRAGRISEEVPA